MFERHALQPSAENILGTQVRQVDHVGSFACRNVYGRESGRRSEHATAEALDVIGFRLANGERITLLEDWGDEGPTGTSYVTSATMPVIFGNTLSPDYNAAHADHFHFGMRGFRLCR